ALRSGDSGGARRVLARSARAARAPLRSQSRGPPRSARADDWLTRPSRGSSPGAASPLVRSRPRARRLREAAGPAWFISDRAPVLLGVRARKRESGGREAGISRARGTSSCAGALLRHGPPRGRPVPNRWSL